MTTAGSDPRARQSALQTLAAVLLVARDHGLARDQDVEAS